ncbi:ABC transporter permease [uncultured Roseobacter sp.]|uniref:ABC transporter permease n=1 Tax=uncultured Roseobacter sp. TaxID=114847 RepID=UPI002604D887|nr:ABC transporter permease subunit [uncultured Roseobacter sp.]
MRLINQQLSPPVATALKFAPFVLLILVYLLGSAARLAENPNDKLLPALSSIAAAVDLMAFTPDRRTGDYLLWSDTWSSLKRLSAGLGISTVLALMIGIGVGTLPFLRALLVPFVNFISMVPPLALLPILFISLGLGETSKIALIVIGVAPIMIRDLAQTVLALPREQIVKAETLSASSWLIAVRIVLPQVMPRLLSSLRLQLGPAFLFLIAAEAISADSGLGYRIFLVRRYLSMDVIFPYVAWITFLAASADFAIDRLRRRLFPWSELEGGR